MKFKAIQIAEILEGDLVGDPHVEVYKLSKIEEGVPGSVTFLANLKYKSYIYQTKASVVIVSKTFTPEASISSTLIRVEDPYLAFSKLLEYYNQIRMNKTGIEQPVFIASTATVGSNVYIGAFSYIGDNVVIGDNVKIYPNSYVGDNTVIGDNTCIFAGVKIYSETVIGKSCTIHSGTVIGSDGFGFAPADQGAYSKVPQIGNVIIEDNVDIGASCTIDRATLGSTIIRCGVKLDNQIQVAHNVEIQKNTVIAAQTGIAGSTKIGESCMIGGQVGIVGHLSIGDRVRVQAQSGIARNVKNDEVLQGTPALSYAEYNRAYVIFKKLPSLMKRFLDIEKNVQKK